MARVRRFPKGARLGWPGLTVRWLPVGLVAGGLLSAFVISAGFPDWAELIWQLLQCTTAATVATALAFWGLTYEHYYYIQRGRPVERRRPLARDEFWLARPMVAVMLVVVGITLVVTGSFLVGTGEWYSFADY